jgi:hypothetical protein
MTTTNDQDEWAPLDVGEDELETFTALREDVPPWLEPSLWEWIYKQFAYVNSSYQDSFRSSLARKCERFLRTTISDQGDAHPSLRLRSSPAGVQLDPADLASR